jgi:coatomer protein complex subunit epsilon
VAAARSWAQDNLLVNLAESWLGLRIGGEKYQQAFYVFEELGQAEATSASKSLVGQSIAELHLGRYPEAEAAIGQALAKDPNDADALVNAVVLSKLTGTDSSAHLK